MKTVAALCLVAAVLPLALALTPVTVHPPTGPITGYVGTMANEFRAIPYAKPPVGDLRWQPTEPATPWDTPLMAQADGPGCPQNCELPHWTCPPTMSENCLLLNVFTPKNATPDSKLATMLFIHGGNFKQGYAGGILYDGSWIAGQHNVIVVVIQYRLGALGFLYTPDGINGNFGIQDQQMSFQWVKKNIAAFGGDPNLVTAFGQSAGAMSIAVHMVADSSEGLFQHAIMESEPFGLPFRTPETWKDAADALAKYAGCDSTGNFTACMMQASVADIIGSQVRVEKDFATDLSDLLQLFLPWTPTAGTPLLAQQPMALFQEGKSHDIPFMIGTVWNEATIFVYEAFKKPLPKTEYEIVLGLIFGLGDAIKIAEHFPVPANETDDCRLTAAKVATQALFVCSTRNVSLITSANQAQPVHVYHYDHLMNFGKFIWGTNFSICDTEVCHGADLVPVFHPKVTPFNVSYTPDEEVMSASMDTFWTNVAKTGSPGSFNGINFKAFDAADQYTMLIQTPTDTLESKEFEDECAFWTQLDWWSKHVGKKL